MQIEPRPSRQLPAEWTGARLFIEKWLGRRCAVDSMLQFIGGAGMFVAGLVALVLTSVFIAAVVCFLVFEISALLAMFGFGFTLARPFLFGCLSLAIMALSIYYAWNTRCENPSAARFNFDTSVPGITTLALEFISAGPIFMVLAAQDFHKAYRLNRTDIPQVSAVLLWLYDKNGRASFAEISMEFPGLNIIRVLPQLRDISGVYWWPEEGELALSEELQKILGAILGREPKNFPYYGRATQEPPHAESPGSKANAEMVAWYSTLGLPPFATLQQVKTRYRKLAKIHHPDARARHQPPGGIADDEQIKRINEAYHSILKHSQNRAGNFE
jgi:DnaJ domain